VEQTNEQVTAEKATKPKKKKIYVPKPGVWTPIEPVREHILELMNLGWSRAAIAKAADCAPIRITVALERRQDRMSTKTAEAILAVKHQHTYADDERHLPYPTQRRLGALMRIGWPMTTISEHSGVTQSALDSIMNYRNRITVNATHALGVQVAYEKLSQTPGPRAHTRLLARAAGWPPPAAWTPDELDDPEPTVIHRVRARWEKQDQPTPGELLYDLIESNDYTHEEFAALIGVQASIITGWVADRYLPRAGYVAKMKKVLNVEELPIPTANSGPPKGSPPRGGRPRHSEPQDEQQDVSEG
jgi:hypothetical protein